MYSNIKYIHIQNVALLNGNPHTTCGFLLTSITNPTIFELLLTNPWAALQKKYIKKSCKEYGLESKIETIEKFEKACKEGNSNEP